MNYCHFDIFINTLVNTSAWVCASLLEAIRTCSKHLRLVLFANLIILCIYFALEMNAKIRLFGKKVSIFILIGMLHTARNLRFYTKLIVTNPFHLEKIIGIHFRSLTFSVATPQPTFSYKQTINNVWNQCE